MRQFVCILRGLRMKKSIIMIFLLFLCLVTACSSEKCGREISMNEDTQKLADLELTDFDTEIQNISELRDEEEIESPEEIFSVFGIPILLPENNSWIKNTEYTLIDENNLEVCYYDDISGIDCKLSVIKNGTLDDTTYSYDETLDETWQGDSLAGDTVYVKVQHSVDDGKVFASWEYKNYKFAIQGDIDPMTDTSPIPKTALYIISKLP